MIFLEELLYEVQTEVLKFNAKKALVRQKCQKTSNKAGMIFHRYFSLYKGAVLSQLKTFNMDGGDHFHSYPISDRFLVVPLQQYCLNSFG